ncbi:DnaB-like helicase C-terminal domain-containing protein [Treponema ruminis]|uniref:Replicative DNA helicase n=1 Tax=Treponema ruminis TaxID=744515 RepID=A0A7W8LL06_9SPIR|nr:DnaB-like helicase C-terminal domain-containing protein [Treponema ruminis]MBB5224911.1 replicative DNA helicase [Treponema ruminis]
MEKENEITEIAKTESGFCTSINEALNATLDCIEKKAKKRDMSETLQTGFGNLDFHKGELIILGAWPYIGKSTFAISLIKQIAVDNKNAVGLIIPGNFDNSQVSERMISMCSYIPIEKIHNAKLEDSDIKKIHDAATKIYDSPLYFMNTPNCSLIDIKIAIESMVKKKAKLIVIEGFEFLEELVDSEPEWYRASIESILNNLKALAMEFDVPIMIVMDLPRPEDACEPRLTDFKKYMIIPRIADKVLFINRYRNKDNFICQEAKLIIAKNNNGSTGNIALLYQIRTGLFLDRARDLEAV